ncbi:heme lyase CcmF/NrfE family subunit [Wenzhouxiangella marina]|uniref:Cytochrome C biogenesis protein CcmF n=1 Tax=Wenzhouxiangella marina TaxID=1579979 RepID=A0A0K0XY18_9GAMM|nr:heme lyase CcmF/NrfE family subunit [Wenzhouxiangella marina]AKS42506.1 cytochrome C biogenesis protein CcmF [Wenzhouxiangella marina]MBB6085718.1 cytochrome c-type biogenesis protein CcmF [Wenzhouxiangella marina]
MIPELGQISLILALILATLLATVPLIGAWRGDTRLMRLAPSLVIGHFVFVALAYLVLSLAFVQHDFTVTYVAMHSNLLLPLAYRLSAVWGGHEGSLLLWILMLAGWMLAVTAFSRSLPQAYRTRVLSVMGMISIGFLLFTLLTSNPFERILPGPPDGRDLNPLLQDPGMIFHPPLLYMGYVGFAVAFAFAIAGLIGGRVEREWVRWSRPWTLIAWSFLTAGITLGSWWAYYELGWGGWWFWDPVENASFIPWLIGTALIHSQAVTEKRGAFPAWTVLLAIAAFSMSLLGTFLVRSGVLTSVHAFANDPERGLFILGFMTVVTGGALLLYALRAPRIMTGEGFDFVSRESALLINNLFFTVSAGMVLLGTLYPLVSDFMGWSQVSVGPPYFSAMFILLMTPVVLLVPLGPMSRWKQDRLGRILKPLAISAVVAIVGGLACAAWFDALNWRAATGWIGGLWLIFGTFSYLKTALRGRRRGLPRHQIGMILAHAGIGVFVIGVAMVGSNTLQRDVRVAPGDTVELAGYRFVLDEVVSVKGPNWIADEARFRVFRGDRELYDMTPQKRRYHRGGQIMTQVALRPGVTRDLYIAMGERLDDAGAWSMRIHIKPFVRWIWGGALLLAIGGLFSAADRRYWQAQRAERSVPVTEGDEVPA